MQIRYASDGIFALLYEETLEEESESDNDCDIA